MAHFMEEVKPEKLRRKPKRYRVWMPAGAVKGPINWYVVQFRHGGAALRFSTGKERAALLTNGQKDKALAMIEQKYRPQHDTYGKGQFEEVEDGAV